MPREGDSWYTCQQDRSDEENLVVMDRVTSGAPLPIQTSHAPDSRGPATLRHLGSCCWWVKRDFPWKETKGHMLVKRNEGEIGLGAKKGDRGERCPGVL